MSPIPRHRRVAFVRKHRMLAAGIAAAAVVAAPAVVLSSAPDADNAAVSTSTSVWSTPNYGLWGDSVVPATPADPESNRVSLGVKFTTSRAGSVGGLQFYRDASNSGPHIGKLWTSRGKLLAKVTFPTTSGSGWVSAALTSPVKVKSGVTYVASYTAPAGHYAADEWALSPTKPRVKRALTATRGVYTYGTGVPSETYHDSNYYVDVLFAPANAESSERSATTSTATATPTETTSATPTETTSATPTETTSATPTETTSATPTETTSATPTQTTSGIPDASNTGVPAGTSLVSVPGQQRQGPGWKWDGARVVVTQDNAVISGLDVNGAVYNGKKGVIIKNSRIRCTKERDWCVTLGAGAILTDSEIGGGVDGSTFQPSIGVLSGYWASGQAGNVVRRVNIHHTVHGMRVDGDTTVVDSYLHDFPMGQSGWETAHTDGIMCTAGASVTVRHNRLETGNTAPFFVQWQSGNVKISGYLIENNYIVGVKQNNQLSSYGVFFENKGIASSPVIRNNTFAGVFEAGHILAPRGSSVTGNVTTDGESASVEYQG